MTWYEWYDVVWQGSGTGHGMNGMASYEVLWRGMNGMNLGTV